MSGERPHRAIATRRTTWRRPAAFCPKQSLRCLRAPTRPASSMEYLDPGAFPVWKERLRDGEVDLNFAAEVGRRLGTIHAKTAGASDIAARFATDAVFDALRLEPYIEAAARRNPTVARALLALSARTLATRMVLVHGDVSPKNILGGPRCFWMLSAPGSVTRRSTWPFASTTSCSNAFGTETPRRAS